MDVRGSIRLLACCGYRHARERGLLAFYGGLLACGGQALSLRGARPFQREERRWRVKQQVRSVSHDTVRFNPAASSPGSSMASPSCRTLVRCTENCPLDLAGLRRIPSARKPLERSRNLAPLAGCGLLYLARVEFSQVIVGFRVVGASVPGRLTHLLLTPVLFLTWAFSLDALPSSW